MIEKGMDLSGIGNVLLSYCKSHFDDRCKTHW